jgi:uncharacterized repeat protein (TIGR01451 family)
MKLLKGRMSLTFRFGALVAALLLGQQAMAAGTRAGTSIDNQANVDYTVGGVDQDDIDSNTVSFVVDRRVDFLLEPIVPATLEDVTPGEQNAWVDFRLTNLSNSELDFNLLLDQVASTTTVGPGTDNADMDNIEYAVSTDIESATNPDPAQAGPQYVDELPADESIRIRVWGDAATTLLNAQVAGVELTATAAEPGALLTEGAALNYTDPATDGGVENVAGDVGNDGVEVSVDGFVVVSAELTIAKDFVVIDDGFGGTDNPLPGAIVEYTITVNNLSTVTPADNVVITDTLDLDLGFLADWSANPAGSDMEISINGASPATGCTQEADTDGCEFDGSDLTFNIGTISTSGSAEVTFRVTINDPATTP